MRIAFFLFGFLLFGCTPKDEPQLYHSFLGSERDTTLHSNEARFDFGFDVLEGARKAQRPVTFEIGLDGKTYLIADGTDWKKIGVKPGSYTIEVRCNQTSKTHVIKNMNVQGGKQRTVYIRLDYRTSKEIEDSRHVAYKPVIYCYPEKDLPVTVTLLPKGELTFTYPEYGSGWNGIAHPDGSTTIGGRTYPYLFWEGTADDLSQLVDYSDGAVLSAGEVVPFLEEQLDAIGFNAKEKTDFITFWGPRMEASERGHAYFLFNKEYDAVAGLNVEPKPDAVFRVYLLWTPLGKEVELSPKPQVFPKMKRDGFHVVEWGGSELKRVDGPEKVL